MEYVQDFLKKKKSKYGIAFSVLFFIIAFSSIPIKLAENNSLSTFDWIYFIVFFFNGTYWLIFGLGYQVERLFGKAYVRIDNEKIAIKTGIIEKLQEIKWDEIMSINYKSSCFEIKRNNGTDYSIRLSSLEYSTIQEIKNVIKSISKNKNIEVQFIDSH
jgi:uncharacterized membrane protein